jgi:hypothetical protein
MRGGGTIVDAVAKLSAQHALKTQKDYQKKTKLNMTKYVINVILKLQIPSFRVGLSK